MLSHNKSFTNVNGQPTPPPSSDHLPIKTVQPASMEAALNGTQPETKHHHIWLITGPAGCGKSTVAQYIAKALNLPYIEGDEFHPQANIDKMASGIPLTDADRWDWLTALREESLRRLTDGSQGVVLTCSALKRKYRDVIRVAPYYDHNVLVHFVYLHAPEAVLLQRVGARKGHYMGANMVHSQFGILEPPGKEETDVISVDVSGPIEQVEREVLSRVEEAVASVVDRDC
ncbi:gluconokinase [Coleophoma crateriformis]|uniref:Gluconokinase n=1 Tax=Coleophoma crateriformis TaxID=565419 RepID=A0A3D8SHJ3_9HELO|nr:gluconokinase [Coleophoma crateriformis]